MSVRFSRQSRSNISLPLWGKGDRLRWMSSPISRGEAALTLAFVDSKTTTPAVSIFAFGESHELAFVDSKTNTPACHLERSKQPSVVCVVEPDVRRALRRSEISRDSLCIVIFVIKSNLQLRKPRKLVSRSRPQAVALTVLVFRLRPVRVRLRSG